MKKLLIISLLLISCGCATKEERSLPVGVFKSHGIYNLTGNLLSYKAPHAATGYAIIFQNSKLLKETTEVPATRCVSFGYEYELRNLPDIVDDKITILVKHPLIKNYLGMKSEITSVYLPIELEDGVYKDSIIYVMRHDYEVLPGPWDLQIVYHDKVLLSKVFNVYETENNTKPNEILNCDAQ